MPLVLAACSTVAPKPSVPDAPEVPVNLAHLDHLGEPVQQDGQTLRIVHIYANAPSYAWVGDDDEGIACVDDAARAAVVYLHDFELHGTAASRAKAEELLRFVAYMQTERGTFYNFVWDRTLRINTTHQNSKADRFEWWAARGVWALGEGARVLKAADPAASQRYAAYVRRSLPRLREMLQHYGHTTAEGGRTLPRWMLNETAFDATSELLLGLTALQSAYPDAEVATMVAQFSEGLEAARFGTVAAFPYGAFASWTGGSHPWGNSQAMALVRAGRLTAPRAEADHAGARFVVDGPWHYLDYATGQTQPYEQIAYDIRTVAVGLADLYGATREPRYAVMAGLVAAWLTGNNAPAVAMYSRTTGRTFDGINSPTQVNRNSGAESTIEALMTLQAINRYPEARAWLTAKGDAPVEKTVDGSRVRYRVFTVASTARRGALVLDLTRGTSAWVEGAALDRLLAA